MFRILPVFREKIEYDFDPAKYSDIVRSVKHFFNDSQEPEDKLLAFEYAMFVFRTEYAALTRTRMFRRKDPKPVSNLWPEVYYTAEGIECNLVCSGREEVHLDENVAVTAWRPDRVRRILPVIKKDGFEEDPSNHDATFYPELDLMVVTRGNHSASAGIFFKSGSIHADVYPISDMFEHVTTDGYKWKNKHSGEELDDVIEPYIALLYEIAQAKYEFLKDHPELTL